MIFLKSQGNRGKSIAVRGSHISNSNRGYEFPICGAISAILPRALFLPNIWANLRRDYLTKVGIFGETWIAHDPPKILGK